MLPVVISAVRETVFALLFKRVDEIRVRLRRQFVVLHNHSKDWQLPHEPKRRLVSLKLLSKKLYEFFFNGPVGAHHYPEKIRLVELVDFGKQSTSREQIID